MMHSQEEFQLTTGNHDTSLISSQRSPDNEPNQAVHFHIEEENARGRFIPNLLLVDKLHSNVDSSTNTLLGHMCSYNSQYLPLYIDSLPQNDELINKTNNFGNSPLDIASLYCTRPIVDKLRAKGATSKMGADYWAIRGGNLGTWSGDAPMAQEELIHWAAFNDLPEVLEVYHAKGASLTKLDLRGATPIDTAVLNKSYRAFKYLLDLGYLPNPQVLTRVDSQAMNAMYEEKTKKRSKLSHPITIYSLILLCQYLLLTSNSQAVMIMCELVFYLSLVMMPTPRIRPGRVLNFQSKILKKTIQWGNNHLFYLLFNITNCFIGIYVLRYATINNYLLAFSYWLVLFSTLCFIINTCLEVHCINTNNTHSEMFYRHRHPELYKKVKIVKEMHMVYHDYHNPHDNGICSNWKYYFGLY